MNGVPRHSLPWFFLAQLAVVVPHVPRLPWWLLGVWAICAVWRVQVFRGHWSWPGRWAKTLIVIAVLAGILGWYRNPTALESAVGTVIALFFLKLLECYRRRDVYLLSFVAFFVAALSLLFGQDVLLSLWVLLSLGLLLVSLMALHDPQQVVGGTGYLRTTAVLLLQALPLMLVLFLVFPRLAPMWTVPVPGGQSARTGMGDSMTPGDISRLGRSAEPAFRARFSGPMPPRRELYWRGLALEHFDGRSWRTGYNQLRPPEDLPLWPADCEPLAYEVILEPTGGHWLLALEWAGSPTPEVVRLGAGTLGRRKPIGSRFRYEVFSCLAPIQNAMERVERFSNLSLPPGSNPRSREWAANLRLGMTSDREFIDALLQYFRQQAFFYTLEPPLLGEHSVDEFLFSTRRGFCEHYAGAMAFLLRAAGIPARVLIGYQGGEPNPFEAYVLVQQYDAHAWVEAWLPGEGWVRLDPTAAVAPERIEAGMSAVMGSEAAFMADSPLAGWARGNRWTAQLRLWFDRIDYRWQRWVLGYDSQRQFELLQRLLGEISPLRIAGLMLAALALAALLSLFSLRGRGWMRPRDPVMAAYARFCRQLARQGLPRRPGEAPQDYARRAVQQWPQWQSAIEGITDAFVRLCYAPDAGQGRSQQIRLLRHRVRRFVRRPPRHPVRTGKVRRTFLTRNGEDKQ